jgi:sec-independent protein translocase protein TatA
MHSPAQTRNSLVPPGVRRYGIAPRSGIISKEAVQGEGLLEKPVRVDYTGKWLRLYRPKRRLSVFGIGTTELLVVLVIVLLVFGAGKLPQVGKQLGSAIQEFKRGIQGKDEAKKPDDDKPDNDKAT